MNLDRFRIELPNEGVDDFYHTAQCILITVPFNSLRVVVYNAGINTSKVPLSGAGLYWALSFFPRTVRAECIFLGLKETTVIIREWSVSQSALWKVRVWRTSYRFFLLVRTRSSWCQWPEQGCFQDTLRMNLPLMNVLVKNSKSREQNSRSLCPFSFIHSIP